MHNKGKVKSAQVEGSLSGCPFCIASGIAIPEVGTGFRIINGYNAGATGVVVERAKNLPPLPNEFLAQMDNDPPHIQHSVFEHKLIQLLPPTPDWAPPLCLEDAAELDSVLVYFCGKSVRNGKWHLDWSAFFEIIRRIWTRRLPIESHELWAVLHAHGVPQRWEKRLTDFFAKGRDLLVYAVGKKPIKKKRVAPLSV
jgi:hypothetical protein